MKKLIIVAVIMIVFLGIKYDLTTGTLPTAEIEQKPSSENGLPIPDYFEQQIIAGDTVISIIEADLASPIPVPMSIMFDDFRKLNNNLSPEKIKVGKTYKFPNYKVTINDNDENN